MKLTTEWRLCENVPSSSLSRSKPPSGGGGVVPWSSSPTRRC